MIIKRLKPTKIQICEEGTFASENGKECIKCPPGNYCTKGEKHPCMSGKKCDEEKMTAEHICLSRYQCLDSANPLQCEKGTYNDLQNQTQEWSTIYW